MLRLSSNDILELAATAVSAGQAGIVNIGEAFARFRSKG